MLFLYKYRILKLSPQRLEEWYQMHDIKKLIYALETGLYDTRVLAAKYLGNLNDSRAIPILRHSINDKVKQVSLESCHSLQKLSQSPDIKQEIDRKIDEWRMKDETYKNNSVKTNNNIYKWKKRNWTEIIREQLRKPMRR